MKRRGVFSAMWNKINTEQELDNFLELCGGFHDCCLKELRYISGAFVNQNLGMYPINDQRKLYILYFKDSMKILQLSR